ncbi:MAG: hypothetical protein HZC24_07035 [Rhodocyclales bacterium]|nr:hypothetical protein [Rhodocyclales bacterium]
MFAAIRRRYPWFLFLNFCALLVVVPAASLLLYYGLAATLLAMRARLRRRFGAAVDPLATAVAVVLLTLGMVALRDPELFGARLGGSLLNLRDAVAFSIVGLSYCWLRVIYVFVSAQDVTLYQFTRYYYFFPTYLSGPVISADDYLAQSARLSRADSIAGMVRIAFGALRFLLSVAVQQLSPFTGNTEMQFAAANFGPLGLWGAACVSGLWLFLNFAAFTDIYIGLGRLLGIRLPENFDNPLGARNLTDFWQRWHITLGNWLRAMVFTPVVRLLGRALPANSLVTAGVASLATMAVCGLWHKLAIGYLIWGVLHGCGLFCHQAWNRYARPRLGTAITASRPYLAASWLLTQAYVAFGWVFFFPAGNTDLGTSLSIATAMLGLACP